MAHVLPSQLLRSCDEGFLYCITSWANNITNGFYVFGMIIAFSIVLFIATQRFGTPRAFGFAGFGGMVASILFVITGLIVWWQASIMIILGVLSIVVLIMNER